MPPTAKTSFRALTVKYNGKASQILTEIAVMPAFDPRQQPIAPTMKSTNAVALWDTGATKSVVTKATADALGLVPAGVTMVNHAGGSSQRNTYMVNIVLPNKVSMVGVLVSECPDIVGNFGAIVGMDIIRQGDFSITNAQGQTWMSFRIPSVEHIDYVVQANRIAFAGVGRNDPCPCGKKGPDGKPLKFKHCHGVGK